MGISNITNSWNVTILNPASAISIDLSSALSQQINWTLLQIPTVNLPAGGNNANGNTLYYVNISTEGVGVDLYVKASGDLMTSGLDVLGIGNETYSYNSTNSSVPSGSKFSLTTNFADNNIGTNLQNGNVVYLKFFLSAPSGQPAGTYNNSVLFKAVSNGGTP